MSTDNFIGDNLSRLRRGKKLMQKDVAARLAGLGFPVSPKTIYNWEKGLAQPNAGQFLALCEVLGADDVLWEFVGVNKGPFAGLNRSGRDKARELIGLLSYIDMYKEGPVEKQRPDEPVIYAESPRLLRLYDIPASAGTGSFLDESGYEMIEAPGYVPESADFALRISGDSMEPLLKDSQVVWVRKQKALLDGEIGIFTYYNDVYCKELSVNDDKAYLKSLNPKYNDIEIKEDFGFEVIGKIVS